MVDNLQGSLGDVQYVDIGFISILLIYGNDADPVFSDYCNDNYILFLPE